jgi:hypothetical protein
MIAKGSLVHEATRPQRLEQLFLGCYAASPFNQQYQGVEDFRCQRDGLAVAQQAPLARLELELPKLVDRFFFQPRPSLSPLVGRGQIVLREK